MFGSFHSFSLSILFHHLEVSPVFLSQLVVVSIGDVQVKLLRLHGFECEVYAGHEVIHVVNHVRVLVDVHGVFVKFESTPVLTHLTTRDTELVGDLIANRKNVGSLGKVVLALRTIGFVQAVTETVREFAEGTFDFQSGLLVLEG